MRYLLMVSHGTMAPGVKSVIDMLLGPREDVLAHSMEDGVGADAYVEGVRKVIAPIRPEDSVVVLGDIMGGSPLTNALNTLTEAGLLGNTMAFGGLNLAMAIAALMGFDDGLDDAALKASILNDGKEAVREIQLQVEDEDEDDL